MKHTTIAAALLALLSVTAGCQHDRDPRMEDRPGTGTTSTNQGLPTGTTERRASTMSAGADQCPQCPGVQTASADGTCPTCGKTLTRMTTP